MLSSWIGRSWCRVSESESRLERPDHHDWLVEGIWQRSTLPSHPSWQKKWMLCCWCGYMHWAIPCVIQGSCQWRSSIICCESSSLFIEGALLSRTMCIFKNLYKDNRATKDQQCCHRAFDDSEWLSMISKHWEAIQWAVHHDCQWYLSRGWV